MAGQIKVGQFSIDVNNNEFKQFSTGTGSRTYRKYIKFDPDLSGTVNVVVALNHIDKGDATGLRINALAENVDREGFDLVMTTWADTNISGVGCSWIAAYG
jgi:hypothetical protein